MPVYCTGTAKLRTTNGEEFDLSPDALAWDEEEKSEGAGGVMRCHEASYEDKGIAVKWQVWEYPEGNESDTETTATEGEVVKDFEYGFELEGEEEA